MAFSCRIAAAELSGGVLHAFRWHRRALIRYAESRGHRQPYHYSVWYDSKRDEYVMHVEFWHWPR